MADWKIEAKKILIENAELFIQDRFVERGIDYITEVGQQKIQELVYDPYTPEVYKRTGELKKSFGLISSNQVDRLTVRYTFGHLPEAIKPNTNRKPYAHASMIDGKIFKSGDDVSSDLPYWTHQGYRHRLYTHLPDSWGKPKPYLDETIKTLRIGLVDILED